MQIGRERKNEIAEAIRESEFSLAEFDVLDEPEYIEVKHRQSSASLLVRYSHGGEYEDPYLMEWVVGDDEPPSSRLVEVLREGTAVWLAAVQRHLATPDLFAQIGKGPAIGEMAAGEENTPFTPDEQAEVLTWIEVTKARAQEQHGLSDEQMKVLEARLDHLAEQIPKLGKIDWINLTVGTLMATVATDAIEPDVARGIVNSLVAAVGHLFGHPIPLLPGPGGAG